MSEWLKEHAWKACVGETVPRVRIPLSPPASARAVARATARLRGRRSHNLFHVDLTEGCLAEALFRALSDSAFAKRNFSDQGTADERSAGATQELASKNPNSSGF